MADETGVPPDQGKHIEVTRMSVGTADVKDMHVDLLEAVNASIGEQTETFQKSIDNNTKSGSKENKSIVSLLQDIKGVNEELIAVVRSSGGGGGDGEGGGDSGLALAELKVRQNMIETINEINDDGVSLSLMMEKMKNLIQRESTVAIAGFAEGMLEATHSVISFRTAVDEVSKKFRQTMELSSSGIASFSDIWFSDLGKFFDFLGGGLETSRDSLIETTTLIKNSLEKGLISPMQLVEGNLNDVAREFSSLRQGMEDSGLDLYKNLGFREQNIVFQQLLDLQLRSDRNTDIRDMETRKAIGTQISTLRSIAENTGMSLEVLIESGKESLQSLSSLVSSGLLTNDQMERLGPALIEIQNKSPQAADLVSRVLTAKGDRAAFARDNPDLFQALQKIGQADIFDKLTAVASGTTGGTEAINMIGTDLQGIADAMKALGEERGGNIQTFLGGQFEHFQSFANSINTFKEIEEGRGKDQTVPKAFRQLEDFFTNTFPVAEVAKFAGSIGFNTIAIGLNTLAINANTGSRGGKTLGGIAKGAAGAGAAGGLSKILGLAGKAVVGAGVAGGVIATGKDVLDLAGGDSSASNTAGLIGSIVGGVAGFMVGGPVGAAIGAGIGNTGGDLIGSFFDKPGGTPAPTQMTTPQMKGSAASGTGDQQFLMKQMVKQTMLLTNISDSMITSNGIQRDIRDKIGFSGGSASETKSRDATRKGGNIAVIPVPLGS